MAPEETQENQNTGPQTNSDNDPIVEETTGRTVAHIGLGAVIFGAACALYLWDAHRSHRASMLVQDARPLVERADVGNLEDAIKKLTEADAIKGGQPAVLASMAEAHALLWVQHGKSDHQQLAMDWVDEAVDADIQRSERFAAETMVAMGQGQLGRALSVATDVVERGGVSERIYWLLGKIQRAQKKGELGRENLRRAQDSGSTIPHYNIDLGDAYAEDGKTKNAIHFWALGNRANSNFIPAAARHLMGRMYKGEAVKSLEEDFTRLKETPPELLGPFDEAAIALTEAEMHYYRGKLKEALGFYQKAIELAGETPLALYRRGQTYLALNKTSEGLKDFETCFAARPHSKHYLFALARTHAQNKGIKKAIALFKEKPHAQQQTTDAAYDTALGDIYLSLNNYKLASGHYDKALKIREKSPEALLGRGISSWKQRKHQDALSWFEKAVNARENFPEVYEAIGLMWIEQKAVSQANTQLQQAEKLYKAKGTDAVRMNTFYGKVIRTLITHKKSSLATAWAAKQKAHGNKG
jgi:tetratricopeptide (TPR) repeat protein